MSKRDQSAFFSAFETIRQRGFRWDSRNCALGAFSLHAAYHGADYARRYRGTVRGGALAAMRRLKEEGGLEGVLETLGFVEIPKGKARRGDLAIYRWDRHGKAREALGAVVDSRVALQDREDWQFRTLSRCASFWRHGEHFEDREK
jgi:hypothetical protein